MGEKAAKVLVVAGEGPCRKALLEAAAGCERLEVSAAGTLAEARAAVDRDRPAVILAASRLADGAALDFLGEERAAGELPLVVAAGDGDDPEPFAALDAGAADVLFPDEWTPSGLERAVHRARRLAREAEARRVAEGALGEYRRRLDLLTRTLGVGFLVISREYRVLWANEFIGQVFGEVAGQPCYRGLKGRDEVCPGCGVREVFEGAERVVHEQEGVDRHGNPVWAQAVAVPVRDEEGRTVSALELVLPITERKAMERELQESEARYRKLFQEFQGVLDAIPDTLVLLSPELRVLWANRGAAAGIGRDHGELVGGLCHEVWHCRGEPCAECPVQSCFLTGEPHSLCTDTPDGRWWELRAAPIRDETGAVVNVVEMARDISRQRVAEAEREELIRDLGAKNTELEQFTHTVSHDLKGPLTTIRGFVGLLLREIDAGRVDKLRPHTTRVAEAAGRMQELLDELLELSRIGRLTHAPEPLLVGELVREALASLAVSLQERGVEVVVAPEFPEAWGDRTRLREVLENLIANAVKFFGDQPAPRLEVGVRAEPGRTVFFVRDNGIGIEPEFRERIFGLFDKLDPRSEGTGIGLSIVKRIVEVHGGRVWVESEGRGRGSCFCFTLGKEGRSA